MIASRKTVLWFLGGAALSTGLYLTLDKLKDTLEAQLADRLTQAVDQLRDRNLEVRLGGIYALERLARTSESEFWPIMEILTTFVRERTPLTFSVPIGVATSCDDIERGLNIGSEAQGRLLQRLVLRHRSAFSYEGGQDFHNRPVLTFRSPGESLEGIDAAQPHLKVPVSELIHRLGQPIRQLSFQGVLQFVEGEVEAGQKRGAGEEQGQGFLGWPLHEPTVAPARAFGKYEASFLLFLGSLTFLLLAFIHEQTGNIVPEIRHV